MESLKLSCTAIILSMVIAASCDENNKDAGNHALDEFCSVAPGGWQCTITTDDPDIQKIPQNAAIPFAIITYWNPNVTFTRGEDGQINPSLIIDLYEIGRKKELIDFIKSQQLYSWCIPIYYGETADYFIITSPCFINDGVFTDEANACIIELHEALKRIITIKEYNLIGAQ